MLMETNMRKNYGKNLRKLCIRMILEIGFGLNQKNNSNQPQDLGYYIGYKIVESYYKSHRDKKKAIKRIIRIRNYKKFLIDSKYDI